MESEKSGISIITPGVKNNVPEGSKNAAAPASCKPAPTRLYVHKSVDAYSRQNTKTSDILVQADSHSPAGVGLLVCVNDTGAREAGSCRVSTRLGWQAQSHVFGVRMASWLPWCQQVARREASARA
jgi:hypothetical protein